jgi:tetratricopeptide (TPR) repeat protein
VALARLQARQEELESAEELLELAVDLFARWGNRAGRASCSELMGLIAQRQDDGAAAIACYREAAARYEAIGSAEAHRVKVVLGQALAWELQADEAIDLLLDGLDRASGMQEGPLVAAAHAALLPCLASKERWPLFDQHLIAARALVDELALADVEIARSARLGGELARDRGQRDRAGAAFTVALGLYERAGLDGLAVRVRRDLRRL